MTDRHVRVHDFAARRQCDWAARRVRVHAIAPEGSVIVLPGKFEFMPLPCRQKEIVLPDGVMALIFSSVMADVLFAAAVLLAVSYCYLTYVYGYWKRRGVHYMRPALLVGNLGGVFMQVEGPLDLFRRAYEEAVGHPIVGIFIFHKPFLVVRDLEVVRIILAKEAHAFLDRFFLPPEKVDRLFARSLFARKGGEWKHLRVKMSPTFTSGKLKMMFQMVDECGRQLMTCIEEAASKGDHHYDVELLWPRLDVTASSLVMWSRHLPPIKAIRVQSPEMFTVGKPFRTLPIIVDFHVRLTFVPMFSFLCSSNVRTHFTTCHYLP